MKRLTVNRTSSMEYRDTLADFEEFDTGGSLRGRLGSLFSTGRMPDPWHTLYNERRGHINYTVLSYATPIAWHDDEQGWVSPYVRYSPTTSKQQSRIFPAVHALNEA